MRLGELRTITRDFDNKLKIRLSCYDETKGVTTHDLEFDMSNDNELYFRIVDEWFPMNAKNKSLQKEDIEVALKWYRYLPQHLITHQDVKAFHRLECYIKKQEKTKK